MQVGRMQLPCQNYWPGLPLAWGGGCGSGSWIQQIHQILPELKARLTRILDTQMTLALLQELLMALRANDADGYKGWLALGIEQLGRDVAGEVESDWMVPLLVEEERDRLMAWQLGVSL